MAGKVAELQVMFGELSDSTGRGVAFLWDKWDNQREGWKAEKIEIHSYVTATDTGTTTNQGQWKNSTTMPKLCQIRDNLHSNYLGAIFPNDNWLRWDSYDQASASKEVKQMITAYIRHKMEQCDLRNDVSTLLIDYIDYGNCYGESEWDFGRRRMDIQGREHTSYVGPRIRRISPLDIVFNPTAPTFEEAPKIVRYIKSVGEIKALAAKDPVWQTAYDKTMSMRSNIGNYTVADTKKAIGFAVDGFGNLKEYYGGEYVEILRFLGDYYDKETMELKESQEIIVIDRSIMVSQRDIPSPEGVGNIVSAGWRKRQDNLYHMGPLDNLVGMQYRIDHLQNAQADATDLIVHPIVVIQGDVEPFAWAPEEVIQIIGEGAVSTMSSDLSGVATAKQEIAFLEARMEEYAGAPKEAMGFRTPGEKTLGEVTKLENAAGRIFHEKTVTFEIFLEKLLQGCLSEAILHEGGTDIPLLDEELGFVDFAKISKNELVHNGAIRPVGARHFGQAKEVMTNLSVALNGPLGQIITPHISGKALATMIEDIFELGRFDLMRPNVAAVEESELNDVRNVGAESNLTNVMTPGLSEE